MNNFQELEKEQERQYDASKRMHVQKNLSNTFGLFKFIGQIVDVYLPAMIGVLISAAGGSDGESNNPGLNRPIRNSVLRFRPVPSRVRSISEL